MNISKKLMLRFKKSFSLGVIQYRHFNIEQQHIFTKMEGCSVNGVLYKKSFIELAKNQTKKEIKDMQEFIKRSKSKYFHRRHTILKKRGKLK